MMTNTETVPFAGAPEGLPQRHTGKAEGVHQERTGGSHQVEGGLAIDRTVYGGHPTKHQYGLKSEV